MQAPRANAVAERFVGGLRRELPDRIPPERTSRVVTAFTSSAGSRNVTGLTRTPSRIRSVTALRCPRTVYASSISCDGSVPGSPCSRWADTQSVSQAAGVGLPGDAVELAGKQRPPRGHR